MAEAVGDRRASPRRRTVENTLGGCVGSVWLILGGFLLSLSGFGAFLGIPMILTGLGLPFAEYLMARSGRRWTGNGSGSCPHCGGVVRSRQGEVSFDCPQCRRPVQVDESGAFIARAGN